MSALRSAWAWDRQQRGSTRQAAPKGAEWRSTGPESACHNPVMLVSTTTRLCHAALLVALTMALPACEADKPTPAEPAAAASKPSKADAAKSGDTKPDAKPDANGDAAAKAKAGEPAAGQPSDAGQPADAAKPAAQPADAARRAPPNPQGRGLPFDDSEKQAKGEICNITKRCGPGLGCSGLFLGGEGKCIPEAEAKKKCEAAKGSWGVWGLQQASYCIKRYPDGGKACKDSSECKGRCLKASNSDKAHCAKHEQTFGCFAEMSEGKAGPTICQD